MSTTVSFAGVSYNLPNNREPKGWGSQTSAFLIAVAQKSLTIAGGSLALTADLNLGTNFGIIAPYYKSASANISTTGVLRLANNEGIGWRNAANSADLILKVDASNNLEFNGNDLPTSASKLSFFSATSSSELAGVISDETGTGSLVFANTPTLITPVLGVATATSINKVAITAPATGATLTIIDGKTATISNSLTFSGTDGSTVAFGAGGTVAYVANKLSVFAATSSSELAGVISDETGTGSLVFNSAPTLDSPVIDTGLFFLHEASFATPAAGRVIVGAKSDNKLYIKDSGGTEKTIATTDVALSNPMTTLGDIISAGALGVATRLAGNATVQRMFYRSKGTGSAAAPSVELITTADISGMNASQATAHTLTYESPEDIYIASPASAITQDLPTTNVLAGRKFRLQVTGATTTNTVTLRSSDGDTIDIIAGVGYILVQALQNTPTDATHWRKIDVYEEALITFTTQGCTASPAITFRCHRFNKMVTINFGASTGNLTKDGSNGPIRYGTLPTRFIPGASQANTIYGMNTTATPLALWVTTGGNLDIYPQDGNAAATNFGAGQTPIGFAQNWSIAYNLA